MLKKNHLRRPVTLWLILCCMLIVAMILLGGATRLNEAGLSIVAWKPLSGIIPPLNEMAWISEFEHYKEFPEYKLKHMSMDLQAFKFIFLLEYSHRLLGRILGLVVLLPLLFFWHAFFPALKRRFMVVLTLGGLQGFMGWFMVKSGLVNNPYVSHYRLAIHLSLAFLLLFLLLDIILILHPHHKNMDRRLKRTACVSLVSVSFTIIYGAFVAGLRAGKIYNTFPKMGTEWLPSEWLFYHPIALNFSENPATVQWMHRMLAFFALGVCIFLGKRLWRFHYRFEASLVVFAVILQVILGIMTVLLIVPISLALLHQLGAIILFSYISILYLRLRSI